MNVVYERSGGFGGLMQSLRIEDLRTLRASDKGKAVNERELTPEEAEQFETFFEATSDAPPPIDDDEEAQGAPDAYAVVLRVNDEAEPRVRLSAMTLPVIGAGEAWDNLLDWLDRRLTAELKMARPANQVLTADDLRQRER
jgi:hypothetical protein